LVFAIVRRLSPSHSVAAVSPIERVVAVGPHQHIGIGSTVNDVIQRIADTDVARAGVPSACPPYYSSYQFLHFFVPPVSFYCCRSLASSVFGSFRSLLFRFRANFSILVRDIADSACCCLDQVALFLFHIVHLG